MTTSLQGRPQSEINVERLPGLTRYIYGTTRLGDGSIPFADRVAIARAAIDTGSLDRLTQHGPDYLKTRAAQVAPVFARSGCASWPEFCVRFSLGYPQVISTVGATARLQNLHELVAAVENAAPLPGDIHAEIEQLQRGWYEQHDQFAEPWSM